MSERRLTVEISSLKDGTWNIRDNTVTLYTSKQWHEMNRWICGFDENKTKANIRADREKLIEATETTKPHLEAWYSKAELRDLIWNTPIGGNYE